MKIYSEVITDADIQRELRGIADVHIDADGIRHFNPRRGGRGYELYLEGHGQRHRRARNGREGHAATWDDYGIWMARLYEIDPDAKIAWYDNYGHFLEITERYASMPFGVRGGYRAPWAWEDVSRESGFTWPDEQQSEMDAALIVRTRKADASRKARWLRRQAEALERTL